ncbi:MFS-type transporter involved in bile tolerance, Atg22 family [Enterococcus malodoratus]|uniref:MFS transporter n=1 Tax=Enterococcus malodoratus TaxID=71451 RepID=UPI0008CC11FA|nr:MFS transporter [Enterococcus malodoratus]SET18886.1 MFS-type transporter involved in bile tolerance, Atg22 family [Enterococcus malodoratus]
MKGNRKNIIYLMLGQFISVFGGAILRFALSLFVLDVTGRADIFATVLAISSIPVLFAPIGGAIADRFDRKILMVLMDVANAIIAVLLFLVVGTSESVFGIGVLIFVLAIVGSFDTPVVGASIPLLVEEDQLEKINGISNGILQLSNVVAPIIGGIFYGLMGAKMLVASSIVFFVVAAIIESFLKIPFVKREKTPGTVMQILTADLKDGFKEVKNNQVIFKSIVIAAAINFVMTSFFIVGLPVILRMTLHVNDTMYGIGMGVFSLSSIVGAVLAGPLTKNLKFSNFYRVFTYSGILLLIMNILLSTTSAGVGFMVIIVMEIIIGMMLSAISIYLISLVQRITPKENLGKVMATIIAVAQCAVPLGQLLMGLLFRNTTTTVFMPLLFISLLVLIISGVCFMMFKGTKESDVHTVKD